MKKIAVIFVCMLTCFLLFSGCTDKKDGGDQDLDLNNSVEVDVPDEKIDTDEPTGSDALPDDFTYSFKDPDNSDGVVVTPKE